MRTTIMRPALPRSPPGGRRHNSRKCRGRIATGDTEFDWNALADGQAIDGGDERLQVVHTPGHAPDHICLWRASTRELFCGDLVVLGSTVVIPASSGGNLSDYLRSLTRVSELAPSRLLPAHGPPIDNPRAVIAGYLEHRQQRELQVLAALGQGRQTVDSITGHIYLGLAVGSHGNGTRKCARASRQTRAGRIGPARRQRSGN